MPRKSTKIKKENNTKSASKAYLDKISQEVQTSQSKLSMVLGALIILVVVILLFNYFNKGKESLGPAQKTENTTQQENVSPENLPGNYTVKEGDTLFSIAQQYYNDGYKYPEVARTNNIANPDILETGQTITIPKLETSSVTPSPSDISTTPQPSITPVMNEWGTPITEDKYTVADGDWLSTIAARAYGDIYSFDKIAKANNITNPNVIEPGTVLIIPR